MKTEYEHFGKNVTAKKAYRGLHRDICICHANCEYFLPDSPKKHCNIAAMAYQLSREVGIVLVMECERYVDHVCNAG